MLGVPKRVKKGSSLAPLLGIHLLCAFFVLHGCTDTGDFGSLPRVHALSVFQLLTTLQESKAERLRMIVDKDNSGSMSDVDSKAIVAMSTMIDRIAAEGIAIEAYVVKSDHYQKHDDWPPNNGLNMISYPVWDPVASKTAFLNELDDQGGAGNEVYLKGVDYAIANNLIPIAPKSGTVDLLLALNDELWQTPQLDATGRYANPVNVFAGGNGFRAYSTRPHTFIDFGTRASLVYNINRAPHAAVIMESGVAAADRLIGHYATRLGVSPVQMGKDLVFGLVTTAHTATMQQFINQAAPGLTHHGDAGGYREMYDHLRDQYGNENLFWEDNQATNYDALFQKITTVVTRITREYVAYLENPADPNSVYIEFDGGGISYQFHDYTLENGNTEVHLNQASADALVQLIQSQLGVANATVIAKIHWNREGL